MASENLKLLGVTIDCGLNVNVHISIVCKKASQRIGVIVRLRNLIPTEAELHLYKAAILFHLTYCHLVWHFCRASGTRRLERVRIQERGLHVVFRVKFSSYQQLLEKAKLPTLYNRRLQDICILMYRLAEDRIKRVLYEQNKNRNEHFQNIKHLENIFEKRVERVQQLKQLGCIK